MQPKQLKREKEPRDQKVYIYGTHAVKEALAARPDVIQKVFIAPNVDDEALRNGLAAKNIPVKPFTGTGPLEREATHQGIIALIDTSKLVIPFDTFRKNLNVTPDTALALLGEIEDPHNVGAIIRSAAAFGASGVLIPEHRQAPVTGAVIKVSAGMAFRVPLVSIGNVNETIRKLKDDGFWVYGLSGRGTQELGKEEFEKPSVFVVGNEGAGIREKTEELCDILLRIPMHPRTESLNASVSAAVVLYDWSSKHPNSLS